MTKKLDRQERTGRFIVAIIALLNLLSPLGQLIADFRLGTLLSLVVAAVLSVALFSGLNWVRYLFVLGAACNAFYYLSLLLVHLEFTAGSYWLIPLFVLQIAYSAAACLLLLFDKPVKEFLYRQKNG